MWTWGGESNSACIMAAASSRWAGGQGGGEGGSTSGEWECMWGQASSERRLLA